MTFARGVTLTTATTLGHADTSNLGPTAGSGFYRRWPDDLALLQDLGVTDVRLTFDWPRLQPKPGALDGDWVERFDNIVEAADAIGIRVWATLHDGAVPRWIDNEGGLADADTVTKWWPRWIEPIAEQFGDRVHGWVPFAAIPADLPLQPWTDTWNILRGGAAPVLASVAGADAASRLAELTDHVGLLLATDDDDADDGLDRVAERFVESLHAIAEAAPDVPLGVAEFSPDRGDPDVDTALVERLVGAVDQVIGDGIEVLVAFLDPAIAGPDSTFGLLDKDRAPHPAAAVYLPPST